MTSSVLGRHNPSQQNPGVGQGSAGCVCVSAVCLTFLNTLSPNENLLTSRVRYSLQVD